MTDTVEPTHGPQPGDLVALVDRRDARRVTAVVEKADGLGYTLRLDGPAELSNDIDVRWFDGDGAWHTSADLDVGAGDQLLEAVPRTPWEPVRGRQSERIPVGRHAVRVRVVASKTMPVSREVMVVCLDFSATGCKVSWPGRAPVKGDALRLALEDLNWHDGREPDWLDVSVARVESLPFKGNHVGIEFELTDEHDRRAVRVWRDHWAQQQRVHLQTHSIAS